MTSSLVGSEMCIRDRSDSGERGAIAGDGDSSALSAHAEFSFCHNDDDCACLLYTSDAADDM
eukprot:10664540-Prorocentrum_lima.AAC.1